MAAGPAWKKVPAKKPMAAETAKAAKSGPSKLEKEEMLTVSLGSALGWAKRIGDGESDAKVQDTLRVCKKIVSFEWALVYRRTILLKVGDFFAAVFFAGDFFAGVFFAAFLLAF